MESAGGAALITVLVGGLFAQWINYLAQKAVTERDFNNMWLRARGDQALTAYNNYAVEQRAVIDKLHTSVGELMAGTEALIPIANWDMNDEQTAARANKIIDQFNLAEDHWVESEWRLLFLLSYYSKSDPTTMARWHELAASVNAYRKCVSEWYDKYDDKVKSDYVPEEICKKDRGKVEDSLKALGTALERQRIYLWTGWDNPATLRHALSMEK